MTEPSQHTLRVAVIGGGPAGLMAAEVLAAGGVQVDVYDAMPSVGRKFLLAGKGGMNITHSEALPDFRRRYGAREPEVARWLEGFGPQAVRDWIHALGVDTFIGSSGRVFPTDMKAAPLLRAWLHRLRESGVRFHMRHRWLGWQDGRLRIATPEGETLVDADATVLALGGASWARLGSDGAWVPLLQERVVDVAPLLPSNCGFDVDWSEHFSTKHAGAPLTTVAIAWRGTEGALERRRGQFVVTQSGIEGSLVYAISAPLRDQVAQHGSTTIWLDLLPDLDACARSRARGGTAARLALNGQPPAGQAWRQGRESGPAARMPVESRTMPTRRETGDAALKSLPVVLRRPRPIDEAISSAGGVRFEALDDGSAMLRALPGVFVAGEMMDWEAPTGGYLLTACFGSGRAAGTRRSSLA